MAAYCVNIFGDMLLDKPLEDFPVSSHFILRVLWFASFVLIFYFCLRKRSTGGIKTKILEK